MRTEIQFPTYRKWRIAVLALVALLWLQFWLPIFDRSSLHRWLGIFEISQGDLFGTLALVSVSPLCVLSVWHPLTGASLLLAATTFLTIRSFAPGSWGVVLYLVSGLAQLIVSILVVVIRLAELGYFARDSRGAGK